MLFKRLKVIDKIVFIKNLALMLRSGIPLLEAIRTLEESSQGLLLEILTDVSGELERGSSLYQSLQKYEKYFGTLFINFIRIGEESGTLEENLFKLASFYEQLYSLRKKVTSSLIYPAIIVSLSLVVGGILSFVVLPKLIPFFESLKVALPLPTRILLTVSRLTKDYFFYLVAATVGIVVLITFLLRRFENIRLIFHEILIRIPIFGKIFINFNIASLSRTLGSLQRSGLPLEKSIKLTAGSINNLVYKNILLQIAEWIRNGQDISSFFKYRNLDLCFPKILTKMIEVGEKSGNLEEIFLYNAEFYEKEVDEATKNLANIIEPIVLIFIGLLVAFIAVAIISPIYQITSVLDK